MGRRLAGRARLAAEAAGLGPPPPAPRPTPSDVTRLLRHARRQARLSQRGLADRAGVAQSTIAEIEMGRVDPKAGTLAKLLAACDSRLIVVPAGPGVGAWEGTRSANADPATTAIPDALVERLDREPAGRIADAGQAAMALVMRILDAAAASDTEPIVLGDLAELIWGARRRPSVGRLCVPPADAGVLARALGWDGPALDIDLAPPGTRGWADLRRAAAPVRIGFRRLLVASLDDLVRIRRSRLDDDDRSLLPDLETLVAAIEQTERAEAGEHPRFPAHWDVRPLAHLDWLLLRGRVRKADREQRQRTLTGFCS